MRTRQQRFRQNAFARATSALTVVAIVVWTAMAPVGAETPSNAGSAGEGMAFLYAPDCIQPECVQSEANGRGGRVPVHCLSFMSAGPRCVSVNPPERRVGSPALHGLDITAAAESRKAELRL